VSNKLKKILRLGSAALGASLLFAGNSFAEGIKPLVEDSLETQNKTQEQVTSISELQDVSPGDWAYEALRNLVERYGCIVGYPNQTYRGNRPLSRYEFAAGLNACLQQIERLIAANQAVDQEDIQKLQTLTTQFQTELVALGGRVDKLESRTAFLEDHQFSTVTKLKGEVITTLSQVFGDENAATGEDLETQAAINYRLRLVFDTSFNGKDTLRVRLQSANFAFARGGTNLTDYNFSANTDNNVVINKLYYKFALGEKAQVWLGGANLTLDDVADPLAPYASSFTEGSIAYFPSEAPIYLAFGGAGLGVSYNITDALNFVAYYTSSTAGDPNESNGLFNGQFQAAAQLTYTFSPGTALALVYNRQYLPSGSGESVLAYTGTKATDDPFNGGSNGNASDNLAIVGSWLIAPKISIEGWAMYTKAYAEGGIRDGDTAEIWNAKLSLALLDLFKEGNIGLFSVGIPPYAPDIENGYRYQDEDVPVLIEALYVYQINDNISISPGITAIFSPEDGRDPLYVGTIRTSFKF